MSDLIYRQDVIDALELGLENDYVDATELLAYVKQLPSVEPKERTAKVDRDAIFPVTVCGVCHSTVTYPNNYCSDCGAKLDWSAHE